MTSGDLAEAVVDLDAVAHNVGVFRSATAADVMAVVKADAFGHGLAPVARAALAAGATWLGVTSATEALLVRSEGITAPVLSWLHGPGTDFERLITADVDISVPEAGYLDAVAEAARSAGPARVHLKIDTGMARNGAIATDWPALAARAAAYEREGLLEVRGVWSHLAGANSQVAAFRAALAVAQAAGLRPRLRHLANSAATLSDPDTHFDMVRVGLGIYGVEPVPHQRYGLRPAMTLRTSVIMTKRVPAGTGVSYHHTHTTSRSTTLALIPMGYADGIPRGVDGRAEVLLNGRRCPIVGRVSMDQSVVDAADLPVRIGDPVVVLGPGDRGEPTAADWARWAGTNPNEILTGIGARVPRRHLSLSRQREEAADRTPGGPRERSPAATPAERGSYSEGIVR
jgi:alanine racemase